MHTTSFWWELPGHRRRRAGARRPRPRRRAARASRTCSARVAPVFVMADVKDLHAQSMVRSPFTDRPTLYLYDAVPGRRRLRAAHLAAVRRDPRRGARARAALPVPARLPVLRGRGGRERATRPATAPCGCSRAPWARRPRVRRRAAAASRRTEGAGRGPQGAPGAARPAHAQARRRRRRAAVAGAAGGRRSCATRARPVAAGDRRRRRLGPRRPRARARAAPARPLPDVAGILPARPARRPRARTEILFLDTETTGLAGGTGSLAFLVGLRLVGGGVVHGPAALPGRAPAARGRCWRRSRSCRPASAVVATYNGGSFDLPLLRTRALLARRDDPCADLRELGPADRGAPALGPAPARLPPADGGGAGLRPRPRRGRHRRRAHPADLLPLPAGQATSGLLPNVLRHNRRDLCGMGHLLGEVLAAAADVDAGAVRRTTAWRGMLARRLGARPRLRAPPPRRRRGRLARPRRGRRRRRRPAAGPPRRRAAGLPARRGACAQARRRLAAGRRACSTPAWSAVPEEPPPAPRGRHPLRAPPGRPRAGPAPCRDPRRTAAPGPPARAAASPLTVVAPAGARPLSCRTANPPPLEV